MAGTGAAYDVKGIIASGYGKNNIDVSDMSVNVTLDGGYSSDGTINASGIEASYDGRYSGQNIINATGDVDITVRGNSNTIYT